MAVELLTNAEKVKNLLKAHPEMRDNDLLLIKSVWSMQMMDQELNPQFTATRKFFEDFAAGKYVNPESIRRVRQKVQEECPELRGTTYAERQKKRGTIKPEIRAVGEQVSNQTSIKLDDNGRPD